MQERGLTLGEIGLIAGTRGALGAGLALLLGNRLSEEQKKAVGWTLFLVGTVSTLPLLLHVLTKPKVLVASDANR
jgi:hypothetical protein